MCRRSVVTVLCCAAVAAGLCVATGNAQARRGPLRLMHGSLLELRADTARVDRMLRDGELRVRSAEPDKLVPGRRIRRVDQYYRGVRVFGADVATQIHAGQVISVFGTIYDDLQVDVNPRVDEPQARRLAEEHTRVRLGARRTGELVVLPRDDGSTVLAWRVRAFTGTDIREVFVDAHDGRIAFEYSNLQSQSSVGRATGTLGDSKKMSALLFAGAYLSEDALRPPAIRTYDMKGNPERTLDIVNGIANFTTSDIGRDSDNVWTDGPLGDAHIYAGYTYDYYWTRFRRRGLDDANVRMASVVHPVRREDAAAYLSTYPVFFANAGYYGDGIVVYGVGLPPGFASGGLSWNFMSAALDVAAHELSHGVTEYTSGLIYRNESGALNESFSDIMATAAEFLFQPAGSGFLQADYLIGEDVAVPGGFRSLSNPAAFDDPDHYSLRYQGSDDNGGVHSNSAIANHAFYLAVEGGTNRVSGQTVQGVGASNREQIESAFYRAVTQLLPANATFAMARSATLQAARDLYGANSAAERALAAAWSAVGVQ